MDSITLTTKACSRETILRKGRKLLQENPFFRDLDRIMSLPEFRSFYEKYLNDMTDMKTALMYMKMYDMLQTECKQNDIEDEKEIIAYMLKEFISNQSTRRYLVHAMSSTNQEQIVSTLRIDDGSTEKDV